MRSKLHACVVASAALLIAAAAPAIAHHSFAAEFDSERPVSLEGEVVEFQWVNPHSWLIIDVPAIDGSTERWAIEGGAPSALLRRGWTKNTLPAGTTVKVEGFQAKDSSLRANARDIEFPDGTTLTIGIGSLDTPYPERE